MKIKGYNANNCVERRNKMEEGKKIIIFTITSPYIALSGYGVILAKKLHNYIEEHDINVSIEIERASLVNTRGKDADIILLTPDLFANEKKVKAMFPDKTVKVINRKDYGLLNAENIIKMSLEND